MAVTMHGRKEAYSMTHSYSGDGEETTDAVPKVIKPVTLQMKQNFILKALADPRFHRRGKVEIEAKGGEGKLRRVALSACDGAVLCCIVFHCHPKRGYSFIGGRSIAKLLGVSSSGVAKTVEKLIALGILLEIGGAKKNKAQRLVPNWDAYIDFAAHSHEGDSAVHSHEGDIAVHSHEATSPSTPMRVGKKERKRSSNVAKGTGAAGATRTDRAKARRCAASSPSASKIMELLKGGRHG
ncbi:MAG: hypothetical protein ISR51_03560 [Rhodospirillales bacterium]|nr:hypothetical protein [Rhodospirillales bacterium]